MSKEFKFELNRIGVRELLQSEAMQTVLNQKATEIRQRCGEGYSQDSYVGKNRANSMVYADTPKAYHSNLKNNTILKAIK